MLAESLDEVAHGQGISVGYHMQIILVPPITINADPAILSLEDVIWVRVVPIKVMLRVAV